MSAPACVGCPRKVHLCKFHTAPCIRPQRHILCVWNWHPTELSDGDQADAQVSQLPGLREHRVRNLTQEVETFDDGIQHNHQVLPRVEVFYISLTAVFTAETKNFRLVKQI